MRIPVLSTSSGGGESIELEWVDVGGALMIRRSDGLAMDGALKEAVRSVLDPDGRAVAGSSGVGGLASGAAPVAGPGVKPEGEVGSG